MSSVIAKNSATVHALHAKVIQLHFASNQILTSPSLNSLKSVFNFKIFCLGGKVELVGPKTGMDGRTMPLPKQKQILSFFFFNKVRLLTRKQTDIKMIIKIVIFNNYKLYINHYVFIRNYNT